MSRPLVALTAIPKDAGTPMGAIPHQTLNDVTFEVIAEAGGDPILVPVKWVDAREMLTRVDAVLLTGGGDVDPALYGSSDPAEEIIRHRDDFELELARAALEQDVPLLAICRGHQLLNVALGGTLTSSVPPNHWDVEGWRTGAHSVTIEPGSKVQEMFGSSLRVNSIHHQAIDRPGDLRVIAYSGDGVPEAVEVDGHPFAIGVQWHPEFMTKEFPEQQLLFDALVEAARERKRYR